MHSLLYALLVLRVTSEHWSVDIGSDVDIGPSTEGIERVTLRCRDDGMEVELVTEQDFDGVIYTRGSYYAKAAPCYQDAEGGRKFVMRFLFEECQTRKGPSGYSNIVVLQHDDLLMFAGDAAFAVSCEVDLGGGSTVASISLANPDPSGRALSAQDMRTVKNTSVVTFPGGRVRRAEARGEL